jgi:vacuolar protein sorting-associated protein 52
MIILIKSEFKAVMKERKIYILDYYFDKIEMVLWPRFTTVFEHFLTNIKTAKTKNFKLYNFSVHFTTKRYVSLVLMLYKIASKTGHNMLLSRLSQLQGLMIEFIERLSEDSFLTPTDRKSKLFFLVNNLHFIHTNISDLHLDIELKDLDKLENKYSDEIKNFIASTLKDQFSNMVDIVKEFAPRGDSDSSSEEEAKEEPGDKVHLLKGVEKKKIEMVAQEFAMVYRDKIDSVMKTVKDNAYSETICKHILGKYMRTLIFKYSTFLEVVKLSHPQFFKETLSSHHILLELKNISIEIGK